MIDVEHDGLPAAAWYVAPQEWVTEAACLGSDTEVFYEPVEGDYDPEPARAICATCPVRSECADQAIVEEDGVPVELRYGIRGYLTGAQRESIQRRGGLQGRDPMDVVLGTDGPALPDEGDHWPERLTELARNVVRWLVEEVEVGATLPPKTQIARALDCKTGPLSRVLDALVEDGTLDFTGDRSKVANGITVRYTRRATPRVVGSWLPPHLRGSAPALNSPTESD